MKEQRKKRTIDELVAENAVLRAEIENLQQQVEMLRKMVFGKKSEKKVFHETENAEQLSLFNEAETEARREEIEEVTVPSHKRKKKRSRAEILKELPVEEVVHEVEDKVCDKCGSEMKTVGKEFVHDELVYVPAKLYVNPTQFLFSGTFSSHHLLQVYQRYATIPHRAGYESSRCYAVQNDYGKLDYTDSRRKSKTGI